ncbi:unnamed protein product [Symbiodinium sp. CCMP2456]|nr:unnamed protein product [Symbiodinium sp. CCMP2456]
MIEADDAVPGEMPRPSVGASSTGPRIPPQAGGSAVVAQRWEDIQAIMRSAEDESWKPLPLRIPKMSFKMLLDALLPDTGSRNYFAVNVGAREGLFHDPVYPLFADGYRGLAIEADPQWYENLTANLAEVNSSKAVFIVKEKAQPYTMKEVLDRFQTPLDFDCLKIDIDSIDLPILQSILQTGFSPKMFMIEVNYDFPPPFQFALEFDLDCKAKFSEGTFGASPDAIFREASLRGYSLVAFEAMDLESEFVYNEHNMWFVRNDLLGRSADDPAVTWRGMVRMYWAQFAMLPCLHVGFYLSTGKWMCPKSQIREIFSELGGNHTSWPLAKMSHYLSQRAARSMFYLSSWRHQLERQHKITFKWCVLAPSAVLRPQAPAPRRLAQRQALRLSASRRNGYVAELAVRKPSEQDSETSDGESEAEGPIAWLHVYDLHGTQGTNSTLQPVGLGIYHAGIELFGVEWAYGYVGVQAVAWS